MAERFAVRAVADPEYGDGVFELLDREAGSVARIAPAAGCNLFSLRASIRGRDREVMLDSAAGRRLGNPILFPFPGRVRGGRFHFGGRDHQLDVTRDGHAIHGLVGHLPWRVESFGPTSAGARLAASLRSADHPAVGRQWPFPFEVTTELTLFENGVEMAFAATNLGATPMPMGFGIHPWFRLPLAAGGTRASCRLGVPADHLWDLEPSLIPSGRVLDVPPDRDFSAVRPLGEIALDDVYTGLRREGEYCECVFSDPAAGAEVAVRADAGFREFVVFAPPNLPTICLEPLTCTPDALNLQPRGLDAGLIVLAPAATWRGRAWLRVREVPNATTD